LTGREKIWYNEYEKYYNADLGRFTQEDPIRDGRNWYSYCDSNPVVRIDKTGQAFETIWDIASLCFSIAEVIANPADPMNWIGAAGDLVDVLVPCLGGVGETIRAINAATEIVEVVDDVHDAAKTANRLGDTADAVFRASDEVVEVIDDARDAKKATERLDDISGAATDTKKVANPYGRAGCPEHQQAISEAAAKMEKDGFENIRTEAQIPTPGGQKQNRYADLAGEKNGETYYIQVGKSNSTGVPNTFEGAVARERAAYNDIINYGNVKPNHISYITYYKK
jgi:hypothetical protein